MQYGGSTDQSRGSLRLRLHLLRLEIAANGRFMQPFGPIPPHEPPPPRPEQLAPSGPSPDRRRVRVLRKSVLPTLWQLQPAVGQPVEHPDKRDIGQGPRGDIVAQLSAHIAMGSQNLKPVATGSMKRLFQDPLFPQNNISVGGRLKNPLNPSQETLPLRNIDLFIWLP